MAVVIQDFEATADPGAGEAGGARADGAAREELRPAELDRALRRIAAGNLRRWAH